MEAIIFVGAQASGKTSFYRERFLDTHVRLSLDQLRTRRRERILLAACLQAGQPFVVDNTNPGPAQRDRYVAPAREAGFRVVGYFFECSVGEALRRNRARQGRARVPDAAVVATFRRLRPPRLAEGFDALYRVRAAEGGGLEVFPLQAGG